MKYFSFMAKWRCDTCGYIVEDSGPPLKCPKCGADVDAFYDMDEEPKINFEEDFE